MNEVKLTNDLGSQFFHAFTEMDGNLIFTDWNGFVTVDDVKAGAIEVLKLLEYHKAPMLLNSNEKLEGSWDEANEWIASEWMPKAIGLGLKRFAHIVSPEIFGALSAEEMVERAAEFDFELRTFQDVESAKAWLKSESQGVTA